MCRRCVTCSIIPPLSTKGLVVETATLPDPVVTNLLSIVLPERGKTLGERIADGGYDWTSNDITEKRFPLTLPAGPRQLAIVHFRHVMGSKDIEQWAAKNGYEVALIDDLLAVGAHPQHKKLARPLPVFSLGSSAAIDGDRCVIYLCWCGSERGLLLLCDGDWNDCCCFLLVRPPSPEAMEGRSKF